MSRWIRKLREPGGTLPKGLVNKVGIAGGAAVMALVILTSPSSDEEGEAAAGGGPAGAEQAAAEAASGESLVSPTQAAIERLRQQSARMNEARVREEERRRQAAGAGGMAPSTGSGGVLPGITAGGGRILPGITAGSGSAPAEPDSPERQLREELRLAEIRRAHEALRSPVVAFSRRVQEPAEPGGGLPVEEPEGAAADETGPGTQPAGAFAPGAELAELQGLGGSVAVPEPADATPTPTTSPDDPAGWERIFEGQFLEAVLATQLRGDFAGPAVAIVSTPLWSRDRQRILVPRGTRAIGQAGAVGDWQQARLAVSFHRLVFPSGRYIRLEFGGLDQAGATGLQDRVNRHYLSTIGAAGAVGVISGLTLRGSQPYAGGADGARAGAGIGLGRAAESVLDRYLNRLPTVTIRAGQRLRIIFTSDALVPRPAFRLQPVSRREP